MSTKDDVITKVRARTALTSDSDLISAQLDALYDMASWQILQKLGAKDDSALDDFKDLVASFVVLKYNRIGNEGKISKGEADSTATYMTDKDFLAMFNESFTEYRRENDIPEFNSGSVKLFSDV